MRGWKQRKEGGLFPLPFRSLTFLFLLTSNLFSLWPWASLTLPLTNKINFRWGSPRYMNSDAKISRISWLLKNSQSSPNDVSAMNLGIPLCITSISMQITFSADTITWPSKPSSSSKKWVPPMHSWILLTVKYFVSFFKLLPLKPLVADFAVHIGSTILPRNHASGSVAQYVAVEEACATSNSYQLQSKGWGCPSGSWWARQSRGRQNAL